MAATKYTKEQWNQWQKSYYIRKKAAGFRLKDGRWQKVNVRPPSRPHEEWRPVVGHEEFYLCSSLGRIYSKMGIGRILNPSINAYGYPVAALRDGKGNYKSLRVHIWVARTFMGKTPEGLQINHKDGVKSNSAISNLEFVTPRENMQHAIANGLFDPRATAKLTEDQVRKIRRIYVCGSQQFGTVALSRMFGVHQTNISLIVTGKSWKDV